MAPTPSGKGYWLVASDGGIFTFGDAGFSGSLGRAKLNGRIVGMAPTPTGKGYWLAGSGGEISAFGDAQLLGTPDAAGRRLFRRHRSGPRPERLHAGGRRRGRLRLR